MNKHKLLALRSRLKPHVVRQETFLTVTIIFSILFYVTSRTAIGSERPSCLILYPNATHVWYDRVKGADQLRYVVDIKFPGQVVLNLVSENLKKQGWHELGHDFLNPSLPAGSLQRWTRFIDDTHPNDRYVYQWLSDWTNIKGDIVRYVFRYRSSDDHPTNLTNLEVAAIYLPKEIVDREESALRLHEQRNNVRRDPD